MAVIVAVPILMTASLLLIPGEPHLPSYTPPVFPQHPSNFTISQVPREYYLRHKGTQIIVNRELTKATHDLQMRAEILLENVNMIPPERLDYFSIYNSPNFTCTKWYGIITEVLPQRGGVLITVRFTPQLTSLEGGLIMANDHYDENYFYSYGTITYLHGHGSGNKLRGTISQY